MCRSSSRMQASTGRFWGLMSAMWTTWPGSATRMPMPAADRNAARSPCSSCTRIGGKQVHPPTTTHVGALIQDWLLGTGQADLGSALGPWVTLCDRFLDKMWLKGHTQAHRADMQLRHSAVVMPHATCKAHMTRRPLFSGIQGVGSRDLHRPYHQIPKQL